MHVNYIPYYHDEHDAISVIWCITVRTDWWANNTAAICFLCLEVRSTPEPGTKSEICSENSGRYCRMLHDRHTFTPIQAIHSEGHEVCETPCSSLCLYRIMTHTEVVYVNVEYIWIGMWRHLWHGECSYWTLGQWCHLDEHVCEGRAVFT